MRKNLFIKTVFKAVMLVSGLIISGISYAGSTTATTQASASLAKNCLLSATNISFGTFNLAAGETDANGSINVLCTKGTTYNIAINWGHVEAQQSQNGDMIGASSGDIIAYGINSSYHSGFMWGVDHPVNGVGNGLTQSYTTYGRAYTGIYGHPAYPTPDNYSDTVTIALNY